MKLAASLFMTGALAFGQLTAPTEGEIAEAYRSKQSAGGRAIFGIPLGKRSTEVRDWRVKFVRLEETRAVDVWIRRWSAIAEQAGMCADYAIVETVPMGSGIPRIRYRLRVEPTGVRRCR